MPNNNIVSLRYGDKTLIVETENEYFYLFRKFDTQNTEVKLEYRFRIREFREPLGAEKLKVEDIRVQNLKNVIVLN